MTFVPGRLSFGFMTEPIFDGSVWESFPALERPEIKHGFSWRSAIPREELESRVPEFLDRGGFPSGRAIYGEQTHGNGVAVVTAIPPTRYAGVDALVTALRQAPLVVRVADCGPVYFYDPVKQVIGLAHSGRKGTELNITGEVIRTLRENYDTNPADLIVQLGPCIRPPHYEVPFAATILQQAREAGATQVHDCGRCTAATLPHYYSYRAEKGQTGRMWAVLMLA